MGEVNPWREEGAEWDAGGMQSSHSSTHPCALDYGLVSLGLHCFLRLAHALCCRSRQCLASVAF